jgi:hypothetical protein
MPPPGTAGSAFEAAYNSQPVYDGAAYQPYNGTDGALPHSYYEPSEPTAYGATPQIQNPFSAPGASGAYSRPLDPAMEAQIAQWQSAYVDDGSRGASYAARATHHANGEAAGHSGGEARKRTSKAPLTVVRTGGGTTWQDSSLLEWDPAHFRLFVGNLAGEVTDETLFKAFGKWPSRVKARVVRDNRTTKSKGFGFVSFSDSKDFFEAARDMQGKYIGSHPVLIQRSTTEIKASRPRDDRKGKGKGYRDKRTGGAKAAGVQKAKPSKTKGGLKILG